MDKTGGDDSLEQFPPRPGDKSAYRPTRSPYPCLLCGGRLTLPSSILGEKPLSSDSWCTAAYIAKTRIAKANILLNTVRPGGCTSVTQAASDGDPEFLLPDREVVGPIRGDVPGWTGKCPERIILLIRGKKGPDHLPDEPRVEGLCKWRRPRSQFIEYYLEGRSHGSSSRVGRSFSQFLALAFFMATRRDTLATWYPSHAVISALLSLHRATLRPRRIVVLLRSVIS